ncbi:hypothetical protein C0991_000308 [Blastosporella zonata]|nr:hypothetical protein C0991_000308 [Blastosporella zonata]
MKLFTVITALACAAGAMAQHTEIVSPADGTNVTRGQEVIVEFERFNSIQSSTEVGLVIGVQPCSDLLCDGGVIGTVLYNGPYNPTIRGPGAVQYENFTVTIPNDSSFSGRAQLSVTRFYLIGVSNI